MNYTVIYTKENEGWYTTQVVELPGCISYGTDLENAQEMTKEAIEIYLESLHKHKEKKEKSVAKTFISSIHVNDVVYA